MRAKVNCTCPHALKKSRFMLYHNFYNLSKYIFAWFLCTGWIVLLPIRLNSFLLLPKRFMFAAKDLFCFLNQFMFAANDLFCFLNQFMFAAKDLFAEKSEKNRENDLCNVTA